MRCTTLAIRRRAKLLGPLASQDPLFLELVRSLGGRVGPPNHWSEAWVGVELGVAQAAVGREGQAVLTLQRAVVAGGEFDHPLTATALFELGRLAAIRGDLARAAISSWRPPMRPPIILPGAPTSRCWRNVSATAR